MDTEPKKKKKSPFLQSLEYIGKLISTAVIVVLLLIGAFLIYYVISAKILSKQAGGAPKISLFTIVSGSMEPAIKVGDVILDVRVDEAKTLKIGDVITFKSTNSLLPDMTITHRILDIRDSSGTLEFITKGDFNKTADSTPVKPEDIIGKTVLKIPQLGHIQLFLATKMGWIIVILIPALGIIVYDVMKLFKLIGAKGDVKKVESNSQVPNLAKKEEDKKIAETLERIRKSGEYQTDNFQISSEPDNHISNDTITETFNPNPAADVTINSSYRMENDGENRDF